MENNLVLYENFTQLANKELKKELSVMLKAMQGVSKNTWNYAIAIHNIVVKELYVDDFKTIKDFAKNVCVSPALITKYVNAVKCLPILLEYELTTDNFTVSKANIIYSLDENTKPFLDFVKTKGMNIALMSEQKLVDLIKKYLDGNDEAIENGSSENASSEEKEEIIIEIKLDGKIYQIPEKILQKYEVKEEE